MGWTPAAIGRFSLEWISICKKKSNKMEIKNPFGLFELDRMPRNSMDKIKYPIQLDPTIEKRKTLGNSMKLNFPLFLLLLLLLLFLLLLFLLLLLLLHEKVLSLPFFFF